MATTARSTLLIVADYPYVIVDGRAYAEIPWDGRLAHLYQPAINRILLLGRYRRATSVPTGWFPVDTNSFEVLDGGDWQTVGDFVRNLPTLLRTLRAAREHAAVLYLKLFYLESVVAWAVNRYGSRTLRRPVATLLVGDAADAMLLRHDLLSSGWARRMASSVVGSLIRYMQSRVDLPGYWAQFLADKFGTATQEAIVAKEPWLGDDQIRLHDRTTPRHPATVLFVGRLIGRKRANAVLDAVSHLVREGREVRVIIVGDGPDRTRLEQQARQGGIADRVSFMGWVGLLSNQMLELYDQADIFCLPSFAEGVPLVVIEAMGRGVAVVATAVSGTPEVVRHEQTGLLVPRDDQAALDRAIRRLLDDPATWRRCVDGGYAVARQNTFEAQRKPLAAAITGLIQ